MIRVEVGYIAFDPDAAALFFALISSRYERSSLIVSSNKTFSAWLAVMSDPLLAQSAIDRLQSAAYELVVEGESYRRRQKPRAPSRRLD